MKPFIVKYTDEEGVTTYHPFREGFSFSVSEENLIYFIHFFDHALEDECVITAEVYVEPANPFVHMILMEDSDKFMAHALEKVESMLDKAVERHLSSGDRIFNLTAVAAGIYDELDTIAEKYTDDNYKGLPEQLFGEYAMRTRAETEARSGTDGISGK